MKLVGTTAIYGQRVSAGGYESVAGFVLLAVVAMFFCYLLPTAIRSRQMAADSRMDDRFSQELRVLTRNTDPTGETQTTARGYVHAPRPDRPEVSMDRQVERPAREPRSADEARGAASVRASRAAAASRRAAAARRRLALTLLLLASSIVLWTLFVTIALPIAAPIAVTVVLAAVVVLGRRAAVRATIADRRMAAEQAREESRAPRAQHQRAGREQAGSGWAGAEPIAAHRTAAGQSDADHTDARRRASRDHQPEQRNAQRRAQAGPAPSAPDRLSELSRPQAPVRTSVHDTAASLRISVDPATLSEAGRADAARLGVQGEEGWTPVPVPVPTYTLKAEAPRRQVPPYQAPEPVTEHDEEHSTFGEVAPIEPGDAAEAERQAVLAEVEALRAAAGASDVESAPAASASGGGPVAGTAPAAPAAGAAPAAPATPATPAAPVAEEAAVPHRQEPAMNLQAVLERRRAAGQ